MPVWLASAIAMLAGSVLGGGRGDALGEGIPFLPAVVDPFERGGLSFVGGRMKHKRHRRRRALTQGDRDDIAFIAGMLGPGAGKQFALTLAGRIR